MTSRHTKKSLTPARAALGSPQKLRQFFLVSLVTLIMLSVSDRIIGTFLHAPRNQGNTFYERVIRLKKFSPAMDTILVPSTRYLQNTDGLSPRAVRLQTDARGFIMPTEVHPNPDLRLFFVGGSTTECLYLDETNRFPYASARLLEQSTGLRINSYNAGVSGNNSLHSLNIILNDILPLRPDIIVFMHNINDIVTLVYTGTYWNDNASRSPIKEIRLQLDAPPSFGSLASDCAELLMPHLYARVQRLVVARAEDVDEWRDIRGKTVTFDKGRILREFRANLETFIAICRCRGITPVLMTQQSRYTPQPEPYVVTAVRKMENDFGVRYASFFSLYTAANEEIRLVASENGVMLIDLDRGIPKSREYIYDTVHLNDRGSIVTSQIIADSLRRLPDVRSRVGRQGGRARGDAGG